MCGHLKYEVYFWSVVDDNPIIPLGYKCYPDFYRAIRDLNVTGIITDFALNCRKAL